MFDFDTIASFVLVLAIASVFLMVILLRQKRTGKDIAIWLSAGAAGVLIGGASSAAAVLGMGYIVVPKPQDGYEIGGGSLAPVPPSNPAGPQMISPMPVGAGGPGGGGPGGGGPGMGPMGGGMMGGGMMGGGGGRGPSPKRQLTTLVRKLDLLTGDIAIRLTDEQTAAFKTALAELAAKETLTDEEATEQHDKLLGLLDDAQKAKQDAIGLPFRRGGGGGGPGGPGGPGGGGPGGPGGPGPGGPGPGGPGGGGAPPAPDANPFADEENGKSLKVLLDRVSGS